VLGRDDADLFGRFYGVTAAGNFEGHNILHLPAAHEQFADQEDIGIDELRERIDQMRRKLLAVRVERVAPGKDDKVLVDWNGLMISALARGYRVLGDKTYLVAAERAASFVLTEMRRENRLYHSYRDGKIHVDAMLDDYAFFLQALADLYETTFDVVWIERAVAIADEMDKRFWDEAGGGFFSTPVGRADVLVRSKSADDSAVPSGNSVAVHSLLRLGKLTGEKRYSDMAEKTLDVFAPAVSFSPRAFVRMLSSFDFFLGPTQEIVVAGGNDDDGTKQLVGLAYRLYLPNGVIAQVDPSSDEAAAAAGRIPLLTAKSLIDGKPAAYVCLGTTCYPPVTAVDGLEKRLAERSPGGVS
jgi:uncharacterized protein YyaL (SSP411 family)